MVQALAPLQAGQASLSFVSFFETFGPAFLALGWFIVLWMLMWLAWNVYLLLRRIDYSSAIQWTFLEVKIPPDSEETPKSMELFFEIIAGMHKTPDKTELYFDGMMEPWISCEIQCTQGKVRYFLVIQTPYRQFIEGVLYGQFPRAEITEAEDYTLKYNWKEIRKKFDLFGTEVVMTGEEFYPIRTYLEYETKLAEEDKYIDPHQGIVETFTAINPGEEFWLQIIVRPIDAGTIKKWAEKGQHEIALISGQAKKEGPGILASLGDFFVSLPGALISAFMTGPTEASSKDEYQLRFFNPTDEAKMKGILQKVSKAGFKTKIRVLHIAPAGQLQKPNIGRAFGAFKQFNTFHLNSLKPDSATKSNGPNYIARDSRRALRERKIFLQYQWREIWYGDGKMFNAEELATLYHFPSKYVKTPGLARSKSGLQAPPDNLPLAG
ncbi:MAG: hypothetical protein HYR90_03400 [Candidatus Andersenbacteria bacterium]|nr:hypothetical protein [Candidatus Andersenbacteria bacterium]MBI3250311.1 hypothetical protein [Candidatus Andersenbacteria bacterium]